MRSKQRFPRMRVSSAERVTAQILHRVYNTLVMKRNPGSIWKSQGYDVLKTKAGKYADRSFLLLAVELCQRRIEPTVYLRVMSNYGHFGSKKYLPHPTYLASEKALDTFEWLFEKERKHHLSEDGWRKFGLGSNKIDREAILEGVDLSRKHVRMVCEATSLSLRDIVITQQSFLSPWYLAVCPAFLAFEFRYLSKFEQHEISSDVAYLLNHKEFGRQVLLHAGTHV